MKRRPLPGWLPYLVGMAIAAALVPLFWQELDNDAYYMIAQGREILAAGDPGIGAPACYGTVRGPVQNWLWCAVLAMAEKAPGNLGFYGIVSSQAVLLQLLLHAMLSRHTKDGWASMLAALLCLLPTGSLYLYGLRPEAVSVALVLATALCLERYKSSGKAAWLLGLPLSVLSEVNLHAAMWPYHFAAMAAYLVPAPMWLENDNAKAGRAVLAAVGASALALFLNPYGAAMPAYVLESMQVFRHIAVDEQGPMPLTCPQGVLCMVLVVLLAVLISHKKIQSSHAWLSGGLLLLCWCSYHSGIFTPVASYALAAALLQIFESKGPARIGASAPKCATTCILAAAAGCLALSATMMAKALPGFELRPYNYLMPAADYIKDSQKERPGNVLCDGVAGSFLEWHGVQGTFTDGRCEMLMASVNGGRDGWLEYKWMETGATSRGTINTYGDIGNYLKENGVEYVALCWADAKFPFLAGWISDSDEWQKAELDDPEGRCLYDVYVRAR